jgi:hypothetical protein
MSNLPFISDTVFTDCSTRCTLDSMDSSFEADREIVIPEIAATRKAIAELNIVFEVECILL